jgi:hypothetical protein
MKYLQPTTTKYFTIVLLLIFSLGFIGCGTSTTDDDDPIDKYLGTWQVSDQPARLNYEVIIAPNPANSAEVLLKNFADLGGAAVGLVVGNSIVIDKQTIANKYKVEGTGTYIGSKELRFDYQLDDGIDNESRKSVFTK